jgi:UPF0755 protein
MGRSSGRGSSVVGSVLSAVWMAALVAISAAVFMVWEIHRPGPAKAESSFIVERGDGASRVARRLQAAGAVRHAWVFRFAAELYAGRASLKAGEYAINPGDSVRALLERIESGRMLQLPVTVAEGLTSEMIIELLASNPNLTGETPPAPPEGSLLPETYMVPRGADRAELVQRMREDHDKLLAELWEARAEGLPIKTPEEAVILASIVEKETGVAEERPLVASAFINRLRRGMRLESDPTIIYGITRGRPLGRGIRKSELERATAYNTYRIDGLPPTPIANPGRASLEAVLNPPDSNYIFFVADGTGGHVFAATLEEHNANVARWREIERQRAEAGQR